MQKPAEVLYEEERSVPDIAVCDHYAGNERYIAKAFEIQNTEGPLFDITCDMEDGAVSGRELEHAQLVARMIASDENRHCRAGCRIHPPHTALWEEELQIVLQTAGQKLSHIVIPKAQGPDDVFLVIERLSSIRRDAGINREIPLHIMIETQDALQHAFEIAALPGVRCLDVGLMDLISSYSGIISFDCVKAPRQFDHALLRRAKALIVAAASANGICASHNPTVNYANPEQAFEDASRARNEFGFARMWSIHPSQIQPIIRAMRPRKEEIDEAAKILCEAQEADWGPISFGGELHDRGSYRYYWQLLKRAKKSGAQLPDGAERLF